MKQSNSFIEILESRIAPAAVYHFVESDGSFATITTSKGTNAELLSAIHFGNTGLTLDLSQADFGNDFAGANVAIFATPGFLRQSPVPQGSGLINFGCYINAAGINLGSVYVKGDLGKITVGNGSATNAVKTLSVLTFGNLNTSTQESDFDGSLGALIVKYDLSAAYVHVGTPSVTGNIGSVTVGQIDGNADPNSGFISCEGNMGPVKISGDILGGSGLNSGAINSEDNMGPVIVGGNVVGGSGSDAGSILAGGTLASVRIGGSLIGGSYDANGYISSVGNMGPVKIQGSVLGGTGFFTGSITSDGYLDSITIGGSLIGGGGVAEYEGSILTGGNLGPVKIGGDIHAGSALDSGAIFSDGAITRVTVTGSLLGDIAALNPVVISAAGPATPGPFTDLAIGRITIGGSVDFASIFAGYSSTDGPANGNAQIGAVRVIGAWLSSNLVAGAENLSSSNAYFGNSNDAQIPGAGASIIPKIASITIGGIVSLDPALPADGASYGFVAREIGSFSLNGTTVALAPGPDNDNINLDPSAPVTTTIHEV